MQALIDSGDGISQVAVERLVGSIDTPAGNDALGPQSCEMGKVARLVPDVVPGAGIDPCEGSRNSHTELRDKCSNGEIFYALKEAQMVIVQWRQR